MGKIGTASKQNSEELQQRKMGSCSAQAYFQLDSSQDFTLCRGQHDYNVKALVMWVQLTKALSEVNTTIS